MLHELEGEVDVVRHGFAAVALAANLGFYRNVRSQRIYGVSEHKDAEDDTVYLTAVKGPRRGLERHELEAKYEQVELAEVSLGASKPATGRRFKTSHPEREGVRW